MATKASGIEFKRFYNDPQYWPAVGDTYHEDVVFIVNGQELSDERDPGSVADADVVSIDGGIVMHSPFYDAGKEPSMESYFKRWRREQNTIIVAVECDRKDLEAVQAAIKAAGGKVVK